MLGRHRRVLTGGSLAVPAGVSGFQQLRAVSSSFLRSLSGGPTAPPEPPKSASGAMAPEGLFGG
eukprot:12744576-Alexandrium_andersonii.AAC.1